MRIYYTANPLIFLNDPGFELENQLTGRPFYLLNHYFYDCKIKYKYGFAFVIY